MRFIFVCVLMCLAFRPCLRMTKCIKHDAKLADVTSCMERAL